jgi:creatinine amidohydrolase
MKREVIYSVRGPKGLSEMTWEEVAEKLKRTDLIIVPVGSTEEHGPHMPLAADTIQGVEVSRRVVASLATEGIHAVAGPAIPFGVSLHLMDFPGTITLTPATLETLIKEVCGSLIKHGFRKIVLLVSHNENVGAVYAATQEVSQQPDVRALVVNWAPPLRQQYPRLLKSKSGGHGGEGETARVLACMPELVRMERAQAYIPKSREKLDGDEPIDMGGGVLDLPHGMKEVTPIGCMGDPTVATAETGEKCYDFIVDWTCQVIKRHFNLSNNPKAVRKLGSRVKGHGSKGTGVGTRNA